MAIHTNSYIELHTLQDANEHLQKYYDLEEDFEFIEEYNQTNQAIEGSVLIATHKDKAIISFLQHSDYPGDFFDDEGTGKLIHFRSYEDYEEKVALFNKSKKLYYFLDKYEHGSVHYSIENTNDYPDRRWDVSSRCAIYIPDDYIQSEFKKLKKKEGEEIAKNHFIESTNSILDNYSDYCNGEVYSYTILTCDSEGNTLEEDSVGGYIGYDYIKKEVKSIMEHYLINLLIDDYEKEVVVESYSDIKNKTSKDLKKIPFKVEVENLDNFKIAKIYDTTVVGLDYQDFSAIYVKKEGSRKIKRIKYNDLQKNYNVSPQVFLEKRFQVEVREIIKEKLKNENETTNTSSIKP